MSRQRFVLEEMAPGELVPNPANFRRHPDSQKTALQTSVDEHGWVDAPLFNKKTGHLIDGHARVELALATGEALIPVKVVEMPLAQERRLLRSFDAIGAMALVDDDALASLIESIDDAALEQLLGEVNEPASGLLPEADPDALPERVETRCKAGELWALGDHRLLCGDATKREDVERLLEGETPLLMATDPPYGVELDMEWRDRALKNALGPAERSYMKRPASCANHEISSDTRFEWSEAFALVPSLAVAYVWHADKFSGAVHAGLLGVGFEHFQLIVWDKEIASFSRCHYWQQHEPCWYARKKNAPWYGRQGANTNTVWTAPSPKHIMSGSKEEKWAHPTQKPALLWRQPLENHTVPGELIYEPFAGSGTALIVAEELQRRARCLEIEPRFADICLARWEQATGREAVRL